MERPSKKDIKAAVDGLKSPKQSSAGTGGDTSGPSAPSGKKPNKNRIRKQGV